MSPLRATLSGIGSAAVFIALLAAAALLMVGCPGPEPAGPSPTSPNPHITPGALCAPHGEFATTGDGTPVICSGRPRPRWTKVQG